MRVCAQGLLKVAIDNARAQEKQVQLEKTELKMELFRERELRETLEKTLAVEQKNRGRARSLLATIGRTREQPPIVWARVKERGARRLVV